VDKSIALTLLKQRLYTDALYCHRLISTDTLKMSVLVYVSAVLACNTEKYAQVAYQLFPHQAESQRI